MASILVLLVSLALAGVAVWLLQRPTEPTYTRAHVSASGVRGAGVPHGHIS